jgi:hypothetical protein
MSQRKKLNALNESKYRIEEKAAKITFDGKQFLVRIPKEVAEIMKIKKGDLIHFHIEIASEPEPIENSKLTINYMRAKHGEK